jgi:hypothetical protein
LAISPTFSKRFSASAVSASGPWYFSAPSQFPSKAYDIAMVRAARVLSSGDVAVSMAFCRWMRASW